MVTEHTAPGRAADVVSVLAGAAMRGPLQDLLKPRGLRLERWQHLRTHHRPGGSVSALYRVHCRTAAPTSSGTGPDVPASAALVLHIGATTADAAAGPDGPHTASARIAGHRLRMWIHPHDPALPGLPWATDAPAVGRDAFASAEPARLHLLAYRPLRRAVVQVEHPRGSAYLKLLPEEQLPALRRRHLLLETAGVPAPRLLAAPEATARGVLMLSALPGASLFRLLVEDGAAGVAPEQFLELLDTLPVQAAELPRRRPWAEGAHGYAAAAAAVLPDEAVRIRALAAGVQEALESTPAGPVVPVHGDFHEGNLLMTGTRVTGLLDVDALGPGHRVDDLACLIGHLAVLAAANPSRPHLDHALQEYRRVFEPAVDPAALNARAAGVVLSLVAGARGGHRGARVHSARLRLGTAQRLLRAASE